MEAKNGTKWQALDVFAKCLEFLKITAINTINERYLCSKKDNPNAKVKFEDEHIQWVVTIPAIWRISAKEFMRKAAYKVFIIICLNAI